MAMPTHQPFREWLNSDNPLPPEQAQALQNHLQGCDDCRQYEEAWQQVKQSFQIAGIVQPAAGFGARWQLRLAEQKRLLHRRQSLFLLLLMGGVSFSLLFLVLSGQMADLAHSPNQFLLILIYRLISTVFALKEFGDIVVGFTKPFMSVLAVPFLVGLVGVCSFLSVLWAAVFRRITSSRRVRI